MNSIKELQNIEQAMPSYVEKANQRASAALTSLPKAMADVEALLENPNLHFQSNPSKVIEAFRQIVDSANADNSNKVVDEVYGIVSDELARAISLLRDLEKWIVLLVPKVEDGNNFGVEVQGAIYGKINEYRQKLEGKLESMPDYYKERSAVAEKLVIKSASEEVTSTTKSTDNKDENGDKKNTASTGESTTTKVTESVNRKPLVVLDTHLVMLDGKWHGIFARDLELIGQILFGVYHHLSVNWEKVILPRGANNKSYSHMF
jgi:proteasome activator subunit 3 (PA28 gamma)